MVSAYNGPTLACVCVGEWEEALLYSRQKEDEEECWEIGLFGFTRTHCWAQTDRHTGCDFNKQAAAATAADAVFLIRLYTTSSSVGTSIETSEHSILMYIYIYSDTERTKSGVVFRRHCAAYRIIEIQLSAGNQSIHLRDIIGLHEPTVVIDIIFYAIYSLCVSEGNPALFSAYSSAYHNVPKERAVGRWWVSLVDRLLVSGISIVFFLKAAVKQKPFCFPRSIAQ